MFSHPAPFATPPIRVGLADRFSFARYARRIARSSDVPRIDWRAVALGLLVALVLARVGLLLSPGAPTFALAASIFGIAGGAFVAGKWAVRAPVYQAVLVGVGFVIAEATGLVGSPAEPGQSAFADTVTILAGDLVLLATAAAAGLLARAWSSWGTGRDR